MEKIILAIDAINPEINSIEFACYLADLTHSKIIGVFLENMVAEENPVFTKVHGTLYLNWEIDTPSPAYQEKQMKIGQSISLFKEICKKKSVPYAVRCEGGVPVREMIRETRFADIVIVDAAISFNRNFDGVPAKFVQQLLKEAECPVIIAPRKFQEIEEIIFTYDRSKSSAFAIKQFTYLFPELNDKKTIIVNVKKDEGWEAEDKYHFREWLQNHYSSIGFEELQGDTDDRLFDYLFKKENEFIIMGAYGRTELSRFFRPSLADLLIKTLTQPIFISHH
jgi:hypothetical protein